MNVRPLIVQIQASLTLQMKITMSDTKKEQHYPVHTPTLGVVFVVRLFDYDYDLFLQIFHTDVNKYTLNKILGWDKSNTVVGIIFSKART